MANLLDCELSPLERVIESISKLLEKYHSKPAQFEYYSVMQECFIALNSALAASELIYAEQHKLITRIEIMEHLLIKHLKGKS